MDGQQQQTEPKKAQEISRKVVHQGKWLRMCNVDFKTESGQVCQNWEYVERVRSDPTELINGVDILPIIKYKDGRRKLLMIANYRPPVDRYCLEFPAGLMDNQDLIENATRELKEETGYIPEIVKEFDFSPIVYTDPYKSNEHSKIVLAYIDGDREENINPKQHLESEENIRVLLVDINDKFVESVKQIQEANNYIIQEKVFSFCLGIQFLAFAFN